VAQVDHLGQGLAKQIRHRGGFVHWANPSEINLSFNDS
jgi:hypothetical protein